MLSIVQSSVTGPREQQRHIFEQGEGRNARQTKGLFTDRAIDRGGHYSDHRRHRYPEPLAGKDRGQSGFGGGFAADVEYGVYRLFHQLWPISKRPHESGPDQWRYRQLHLGPRFVRELGNWP